MGRTPDARVGWRERAVRLEGFLAVPSLALRGWERLLGTVGSACCTVSRDALKKLSGMGVGWGFMELGLAELGGVWDCSVRAPCPLWGCETYPGLFS